jgi:aspartyl-tRNA(Asn)/glutamyl-tRNA(Gln) amidotransferase subunit A
LPAACCGVVGFKGSYGLVDMQGILDGEKPPEEDIVWLSHAGITTRSIDDTAIVLDALVEPARKKRASFVADLKQGRSLRIGVADNCKAEKEVRDAFDKAVETIRRLGYRIRNAAAPLTDFSKGIASIASDRKTIVEQSFQEIDVLVLPTTRTTALKIEEADKPLALSPENTMFANYYGLPAVSIPCGFDKCGVPLGLQMIAKPWDDVAILRLAHQFQLATDFRRQRPPA